MQPHTPSWFPSAFAFPSLSVLVFHCFERLYISVFLIRRDGACWCDPWCSALDIGWRGGRKESSSRLVNQTHLTTFRDADNVVVVRTAFPHSRTSCCGFPNRTSTCGCAGLHLPSAFVLCWFCLSISFCIIRMLYDLLFILSCLWIMIWCISFKFQWW